MAKELTAEAQAEKNRIENEKKQLKKDQKEQRKEAKRRAKEIAKQEEALGEEEGNGFVTFVATLFIVVLWLAVICVIVKLDIGGFGSSVLTPVLKDVPVLNKILPGVSLTETGEPDSYGGYSSLREAVDYIQTLEQEVERLQTASNVKDAELETLRAEVLRLKEFENAQVEFQRIRNQFYEEVIYADNGPGAEEYRKWFEEMDPTTADALYRQVVTQLEESAEMQEYAQAYSSMDAKEAAAIFEAMTSDMNLVARILNAMTAEQRGQILANMDPSIAARLTKMMDPES